MNLFVYLTKHLLEKLGNTAKLIMILIWGVDEGRGLLIHNHYKENWYRQQIVCEINPIYQ